MNEIRESFSILFVGTQMAVGGAQRVLFDQARWFKSRGYKVTAAFLYDREGQYEKWKEAVDFPLYNLGAFELGAGLFRQAGKLIMGLFRLWTLLRREGFDVVETFTYDSNILGLSLAWLAGVPARIATHHGKVEGLPLWRQKLHSWLVNIGIARTLVAVSEQTRQTAMSEGVRADRVVVIPNGVTPLATSSFNRADTRTALELDGNDIFLLSIGRLTYQKGHEFLVRAMSQVTRRFPNVKAGICGEGPLRPQLESRILELGLTDHVRLLGSRDDVAPLLVSADIFVLPSRWEGLSIALLEAMAAGIPIIASRVDGIKDLVTDGVHGLLVPSEDAEGLEESILQLLADPQMRQRMGAAAQAHVLRVHTTDAMCRKHRDLMQNLLESK